MEAWLASLAAIATAFAGLADEGPSAVAEDPQLETHHVHIADFDMDPGDLTIEAGEKVTWHNHDDASHTASEDGGAWETGVLGTEETETLTFDEVAEYSYFCEVHPGQLQGFGLTVRELDLNPTTSIASLAEGDTVQGAVQIEGTADDPDGSERVEIRIDGGEWQTAKGAEDWTYAWDTQAVVNGEHTIEVRSTDGEEFGPVTSVNVTTTNPPPDLTVTSISVEQSTGQAEITATVTNQGNVRSPSSTLEVRYEAERAGGVAGTASLPELAIGESVELTVTWNTVGKVGEFELVAAIDGADPTNDEASHTVCVPDAEGLACAARGTEVDPGG
jgi:plastocyanin